MEIQKIEYLENKKSFLFLDDKKSLSTFFYGLPFGEKKKTEKKKKEKQRTKSYSYRSRACNFIEKETLVSQNF